MSKKEKVSNILQL